ncbi:MAG: flagellar motor protein MotB [Betaproteobacteria bacterium]|nr:flagellar motor protein MotB [Betaproteobacteria bacterium]
MLKKSLLSIVALTTVCAAVPVFAAQQDFYGVFSVGRSSLDTNPGSIDTRNLATGFTSSSTTSDTDATAAKVQLGYSLGKTFALEGGYDYLGKVNFVSTTNAGTIGGRKEAQLINLDIVAKIPMNEQFSLLARFGGYYWKTKSDMPNAATLGTSTIDDNGFDFKMGAGVQYDFNPKFGMRAEFDRFNGIGKNTSSGDSKVNQVTVGGVLKF